MLALFLVLGVANFNVLITSSTEAPTDSMSIVLPIILFGSGIVGMIVAAVIKRRRPDVYPAGSPRFANGGGLTHPRPN